MEPFGPGNMRPVFIQQECKGYRLFKSFERTAHKICITTA